jgi:hypothetical protein
VGVPARIHSLLASLQHWLNSLAALAGHLGHSSSSRTSNDGEESSTVSSSSSQAGSSSSRSFISDEGAVRLLQASVPSLPPINLIGSGDVGGLGVAPELQPSVRLYLDLNHGDYHDTLCRCVDLGRGGGGCCVWHLRGGSDYVGGFGASCSVLCGCVWTWATGTVMLPAADVVSGLEGGRTSLIVS